MASIQIQEGTVRQRIDGVDDDGDAVTIIAFEDYTPASVHAVAGAPTVSVTPATVTLTLEA